MRYGLFMSQIEELRAFVLIVETGSLTQAADRMGIAVSAVSRRLRDLELRLGAALIQRSTRRLFLNETGQQFYERAKSILVTLEDAELLVKEMMVVEDQKCQVVLVVEEVVLVLQVLMHLHKHQVLIPHL